MRDVSPIRSENPVGAFLKCAQSATTAAAGVRCNHGECAFLPVNLLAFSDSRSACCTIVAIVDIPDHLHTIVCRNQTPREIVDLHSI